MGSLVTGFLLVRYFPNARGSGIPQTKFALFINNGYISLRTVIGKFLCCAVSLASGIALGREGPSVQIGAGMASVMGRRFGLVDGTVKALVPVGCSAALAAAFNTPIAAVLFSLEEIMGDMHAPVLGSVVIAVGDIVDGAASDAGRSAAVSRSRVSAGASGRVRDLRDSGRGRRVGLGVLREAAAGDPARFLSVSEGDRMVAAVPEDCWWV